MTHVEQTTADTSPHDRTWLRILLPVAAVLAAGGVGIVAVERGKIELLLLLLIAPIAGYVALWRPNTMIYAALFLLYTNAPVIAKRFHGLPYPIVFSVPLLLMLPIAGRVLFRGGQVFFPRVTLWIVLFVMVQTTGALLSKNPRIGFEGVIISVTEGVLLFLLVVNAVRTEQVLRGVVWMLLAAGAFLGAASAYQYATNSYHKSYGGFAQLEGEGFAVQGERIKVIQRRAAGPLGVKNRYAQIMLMLFPLGMFQLWGERRASIRLLAITAIGMILTGWALTFSRGSAVGFALTVVVMAGLGYVNWRQLVVVGALAGVLLLALPQYRTRLASLDVIPAMLTGKSVGGNRPDGAVTGRMTEMLAAARVYADHPIVGVGPTMFRYYAQEYGKVGGFRAIAADREAHCLYVAVAAEFGTLGSVFLFGLIYLTLRDLGRVRKLCADSHPQLARLAAGFFFMIIVYLTTGIFAHFSFIRYFWMMMALATACVCIARSKLAEEAESEGAPTCNPSTC
jgi:hypothetical protein